MEIFVASPRLRLLQETKCIQVNLQQFHDMVSAIDRAKHLLISLLRTLAATYGVVLQLTRDTSDVDVRSAFKKVSRKAHPDQGGSIADQTALNTARNNWQDAVAKKGGAASRS